MDPDEMPSEDESPRRPRPTALLVVAALVALASVLVATGPPSGPGATADHTSPPRAAAASPGSTNASATLDGTWTVRELYDERGHPTLPATYDHRVTLTFHRGAMTGDTGCNNIAGRYRQVAEHLSFPGDTYTSLVGCIDEPPLPARLPDVRTAGGAGDVRYLRDADGEVVLELRRR